MTYEEFMEKASNPRCRDNRCIYRVEALSVNSENFYEYCDVIKELDDYTLIPQHYNLTLFIGS